MTSASKKLDVIRKKKTQPNKSNRKADDKRTRANREILKELSSADKS